ncbi:HAD-IIB family hydrolase [Kineosporia sp. A_224]|uniref:HAD-IIB family hydrolase n=1 Tax=Kineosporia sp. A_224 TaxID=1962180 RepID=UPI000B4BD354|nr:HAD-IIB family hydrolase [Kineosporia sp. A_224]
MRLVASDLDGTIVRHDGTMSPRTVSVLSRCQERGVDVVFVTGRPMRWMPPVIEATGHRGLAILGNGALVYDLATETVVETRALAPDTVHAAVEALRAVLPNARFALETLTGYRRETEFMPHHEAAREAMSGTIADLLADDPVVLKVLCRDETSTADPMLALARPALAGIAEPVHSDARSSLLEVAALGVSKASTLAMLAQERGIAASEVVAFGDQPNDVPMLHWAGRGYAMADGHPEALAAADAVAPPCAEDGVAQVLEALLAGLAERTA